MNRSYYSPWLRVCGVWVAMLCLPCHADDSQQASALARAAEWLWSQQADDGGWHSQTYGLLKSGQAMTPFVLHTLLEVPETVVARPAGGVDRALSFLRGHIKDGALGLSDPDVLEYPNYSTAYALMCFVKAGDVRDSSRIAAMERYLLDQQYREANGFDPQHLAYGGWGFGAPIRPGQPGHMDLAHTRRVLQALRASGCQDAQAFQRAEHFLRLVQKHPDEPRPQPGCLYDGGFYFSPIVLAANKGREDQSRSGQIRSYATATCDGVLALLAAAVRLDDERVQQATLWLQRHPQLDRPAGIPTDYPEPWYDALYYYHLAVRSEAYARLAPPEDWRRLIAAQLAPHQQLDGHFVNRRSALMKEDDPLMATSLATIALQHATND